MTVVDKHMITAPEAHANFCYDPDTGRLTRRISRNNFKAKAGDPVGSVSEYGYYRVNHCGKVYLVHRLIWLMVHGEWPEHDLDHINGNRLDNRLANLRPATRAQNLQNSGLRSDNRTGLVGVSLNSRTRRYRAQIGANGKNHALGEYDTPEEAHKAYLAAKQRLHTFQPTPRT